MLYRPSSKPTTVDPAGRNQLESAALVGTDTPRPIRWSGPKPACLTQFATSSVATRAAAINRVREAAKLLDAYLERATTQSA
jgi:hypothetical protein